jgi:hypothetical protein
MLVEPETHSRVMCLPAHRLELRVRASPAACAPRQLQTGGERQMPRCPPTVPARRSRVPSVSRQALHVLGRLEAARVQVVPEHGPSSRACRRCGNRLLRDRRWTSRPPWVSFRDGALAPAVAARRTADAVSPRGTDAAGGRPLRAGRAYACQSPRPSGHALMRAGTALNGHPATRGRHVVYCVLISVGLLSRSSGRPNRPKN